MGGGGDEEENSNLAFRATISLDEAFHGINKEITGTRRELCEKCGGSGAKSGGHRSCGHCGGRGQVQRRMLGMVLMQTCSVCHGSGEVIANPCPTCDASGSVERPFTQEFRIPKGIYHGAKLRIEGEGHHFSRSLNPGDLYVLIEIKSDSRFDRRDDDLLTTVSVDIATASLGGTVDVPTIDGEPVKVKINSGIQTGATLRVHDRGMPKLHSRERRGDMLVSVRVDTPRELTKRQRELLEELRRSLHGEGEPGAKADPGVFGRIFGKE